jgi:hypothetical protein
MLTSFCSTAKRHVKTDTVVDSKHYTAAEEFLESLRFYRELIAPRQKIGNRVTANIIGGCWHRCVGFDVSYFHPTVPAMLARNSCAHANPSPARLETRIKGNR